MFWPLRSSPQTCPKAFDLMQCSILFWVWRFCAYGVDFNPTLDPGFSLLLDLIFLSQAPNREQMALCNLLPTYFRPIPPFYSPLLQRLPQGVGALKSGSLAPGCFACSEQNGWTAARACSYQATWWKGFDPLKHGQKPCAVPPSHVLPASFQSRTQSPRRSLTALRHSLSPVSFCRFFFFHLSLGQKPHILPLVWGFFSPLCSYLFCYVWAGRP